MTHTVPQDLPAGVRIPYALRGIPESHMARLLPLPDAPRVGDIALARLQSIGKNARLELTTGRASSLHEGDRIAVVFGNRYATMQFEGYARADGEACDLLSMGGVCGLVDSKHEKVLVPSRLKLLGAIGDSEGRRLRLKDYALPAILPMSRPRTIVVCGSSMDVGKTHTAVSLIVGLRRQGHSVAAVKLTGTATGRDTWAMQDAGAQPALDFVDGGYPSTYLCTLDELLALDQLLVAHAMRSGADWLVVEIADGLLQKETSALLQCNRFTDSIDAWVFACDDPLATVGGIERMRSWGLEPAVVSGLLSMSPLAMREVQAATGVPCMTAGELQQGNFGNRLAAIGPRRIAASG